MSANVQSPNAQAASQHPNPKDYEEHMTWRMRWYLIIAITIIYALSLLSGLIAYAVTRDIHYLFFLTPTALIPFVHYLVPMDQKRFELKKLKIQVKTQRQQKKKQIP
jgi:cytochrome c-type biogenesis protein CcmE